jgi:stage III sporulation protein AB
VVKFFGSVIVFLGCGLAGMLVARSYSLRPGELRGFQAALRMLETEITYAATPLGEALLTLAERSDRRVAVFFRYVLAELSSDPGSAFQEAWEKALKKFYRETSLLKSDLDILNNLGKALGRSDRQDQRRHLCLAGEQIALEAAKAEKEALTRVKLWNYLGFLGGLVIILLFY